MLAVRDDGLVVGSVSGGCIEDDIIYRVQRQGIQGTLPEATKYGISAEEAHRFGLPCGGTIELVAEPLSSHSGIPELLAAVESGHLVACSLDMATGRATLSNAEAAVVGHRPYHSYVPNVPGLCVLFARIANGNLEAKTDRDLAKVLRKLTRANDQHAIPGAVN